MIVVRAELEVDPENVEAMKDAIRELETASLEEPGRHEYVFSQQLSNPAKLRIDERWESMEALEAHMGLPHNGALQRAAEACSASLDAGQVTRARCGAGAVQRARLIRAALP